MRPSLSIFSASATFGAAGSERHGIRRDIWRSNFVSIKSFVPVISLLALGLVGCPRPSPPAGTAGGARPAIGAPGCPYREVVVSRRGQPPNPFARVAHARFCPAQSLRAGTWEGAWAANHAIISGPADNQGWYCRYRWIPTDDRLDAQPPLAPFAGPDVQDIQIDCPLVSPSQSGPSPLALNYWKPLEATYRIQAGHVPTLPALPLRSPVTVAVLDTAFEPFNSPTRDSSPHGRAVGRIIHDLACRDQASCPVQITNHLALQETKGHVQQTRPITTRGGFFGTRGQVGQAVSEALATWVLSTHPGQPRAPLVINLSVGWAEAMDKNPRVVEGVRTLPNDLVWQSLRRASCLGALVVAAAGNGIGPSQTGPLAPAAWEKYPAPTVAECRELIPTSWPYRVEIGGDERYRPLVYAAAAVDYKDKPLPSARPGSLPRLVAHGLAVITADPVRPEHTALLTGSSMAAAVVSGVAATAWSYAPNWSAHAIMGLVHGKAVPTAGPRPVELCLGGACGVARPARVSQCATLQGLLGPRLICKTVPYQAGVRPTMPPSAVAATAAPTEWCESDAGPCVGAEPVPPSPRDEPWVTPQPVPLCQACRIVNSTGSLEGLIEGDDAMRDRGVRWAEVLVDADTMAARNLDLNVQFNRTITGPGAFSGVATTGRVVLRGYRGVREEGASGDLPIY